MRGRSALLRGPARGESRDAAPRLGGFLWCVTSGPSVLWLYRGLGEHGTGLRLDACSQRSLFPIGNDEHGLSAAHARAASPHRRDWPGLPWRGRAVPPRPGRAEGARALSAVLEAAALPGLCRRAGWGTGRAGKLGPDGGGRRAGRQGWMRRGQAGIGAADPGPAEQWGCRCRPRPAPPLPSPWCFPGTGRHRRSAWRGSAGLSCPGKDVTAGLR